MIKYVNLLDSVLALISFRVLFVFFSCFVFLCSVFFVFLIWAKLPEINKWMDGWMDCRLSYELLRGWSD